MATRRLFTVAFLLMALFAMKGIIELLSIPVDPENVAIIGLSPSRLAMVLILLVPFVTGLALARYAFTKPLPGLLAPFFKGTQSWFRWFIFVLLVFFSWAVWVAPQSHEFYINNIQLSYYIRLRPLVEFAVLIGWLYMILTAYLKITEADRIEARRTTQPSLYAFTGLILVWVLLLWSRFGLDPQAAFWGEAGTFIFGYQALLLLAIFGPIGALLVALRERPALYRVLSAVTLIGLWTAAYNLWIGPDLAHNFFLPDLGEPNSVRYPYSDSASYDTRANLALLGHGFKAGSYSSRSVYIAFLALLHLLTDSDYGQIYTLHVGFLALSVPFLYLLGKRLYGESAGLLSAGLLLFAEYNLILATSHIKVSHSRLLLTEFFTGFLIILYILVTLAALQQFQQGHSRTTFTFYLSAGLGGLMILTRLHTLPIIIFTVMFLLLGLHREPWQARLKRVALYSGLVFLVAMPWMLRNYLVVKQFAIEPGRINRVTESRWQEPRNEATDGKIESDPDLAGVSSLVRVGQLAVGHFAHNGILSVLALPLDYSFQTVEGYFEKNFHFGTDWAGELSLPEQWLLGANLLVLALGLGAAFHRFGWLGLFPLMAFFGYHATNALARTSGWRYLRPVDWVIYLYFAAGLAFILSLLFPRLRPVAMKSKLFVDEGRLDKRPSLGLLLPLLLTLAISFYPSVIPAKYAELDTRSVQQAMQTALEDAGAPLDTDLAGTSLIWGRILYPVYRSSSPEISLQTGPDVPEIPGPRYEFYILDRFRHPVILRQMQFQGSLPTGADAIALVCNHQQSYFEALALLVFTENEPLLLLQDAKPAAQACPP